MQQAIEALKAGERERAFTLLREYLRHHPQDANGWLWMSEAAPSPRMQVDALERVLALAPDHPRATVIQQRLYTLRGDLAPSPPVEAPGADTPATPTSDEMLAQLRGESLRPAPEIPPAPVEEDSLSMEALLAEEPVAPPAEPPAPVEPLSPAAPAAVYDLPPPDTAEETPKREMAETGGADARLGEELDDLVRGLRGEEAPPPASAVEEGQETASPVSTRLPPTPGNNEGLPWWVWLILLISVLLVGAVLYFALQIARI